MQEYLPFAKNLAEEAGKIILKYFRLGVEHKTKGDLSIVTKADEEINKLVIRRIENAYPDHSIFGEEASTDKGSKFVWQCDPV